MEHISWQKFPLIALVASLTFGALGVATAQANPVAQGAQTSTAAQDDPPMVDPYAIELVAGGDKVEAKWVGDQKASLDVDWGTGGIVHYALFPKSGKYTPGVRWEVKLTLREGQIFSASSSDNLVQYDPMSKVLMVKPQEWQMDVSQSGVPITVEWKEDPAPLEAVVGDHRAPAPFVPYVDMGLYPTPKLDRVSKLAGNKQFTTAFIQSATNDRKNYFAAWSGQKTQPVLGNTNIALLNALRRDKGDVVFSFGGANGKELSEVITDERELADVYRKVFDRLKTNKVDFDIEGGALTDQKASDRRAKVLATLQKEYEARGEQLHVSFTLPTLETGLTADGLATVKTIMSNRVKVSNWNVMAMDYGHPVEDMGAAAIQAGTALQKQLKAFYPTFSDAQLWKLVGITPMLGENDVPQEIFTIQNAQALVKWAEERGIGRLAMWSTNRDHLCLKRSAGVRLAGVQLDCSGTPQKEYEFSKIFNTFKG